MHALGTESTVFRKPYRSASSQGKSLLHPFFHITQLLRDAARLAYGVVLCLGHLGLGHVTTAGHMLHDTGRLVIAMALELANCVVSLLSLVTRTLATIFNFGYPAVPVNSRNFLNGNREMRFIADEYGDSSSIIRESNVNKSDQSTQISQSLTRTKNAHGRNFIPSVGASPVSSSTFDTVTFDNGWESDEEEIHFGEYDDLKRHGPAYEFIRPFREENEDDKNHGAAFRLV